MAISRKPTPRASERAVAAVISRGGEVAAQAPRRRPSAAERTPVIVRIAPELLARVDAAVEARPVPITRHSWILEALHEKCKQESD